VPGSLVMDKDERYYGEEERQRKGSEERDSRKRKSQSSELAYKGGAGYDEWQKRGRSRSRGNGGMRGKSRIESPESSYRKGGAFHQELNIAPPSDPRLAAGGQGYPGVGGGQDRHRQQSYQVCFNW
jgi:hypothetical protein